MKKFSDGEFVKECLEAVGKDILHDKNKLFSNMSIPTNSVSVELMTFQTKLL